MQKSDDKKAKSKSFVRCAATGLVFGLIVTVIFLSLFAALITSGKLPESAARGAVLASAFIGAMTGSLTAAKGYGARPLAVGLAVGGAMFFVTLIGSAFEKSGGIFRTLTPGLLAALLAGGTAGSVLSLRRKKRKRA